MDILDICSKYLLNYDINDFIYRFFDINEITIFDSSIIEKINLLNNDFPRFWLSLEDEEKKKFMLIILNENKNEEKYKIKYPDNFVYSYNNGKKNNYFKYD